MRPLRLPETSPVVWLALAAAALAVDYAGGPHIQMALLFTLPVVLAAWGGGLAWGGALAVALPAIRLAYAWEWRPLASDAAVILDHVVDVFVLGGFAYLVDRAHRQQRELRVLEGMLPICGFCKRIREENDHWSAVETVVSRRSEAEFSHTVCPDCARRHYGDLLDRTQRPR